jgi:hypothetical protein
MSMKKAWEFIPSPGREEMTRLVPCVASLNSAMRNQVYQTLGNTQSVRVNATLIVSERPSVQVPNFTPTSVPIPNDLALTVISAQYDGFTLVPPFARYSTSANNIPVFSFNHKTATSGPAVPGCVSETATQVIQAILSSQPLN